MPEPTQPLETALSRLTEIVGALEAQNVPLAMAMELYEEGIGLVARCRTELEAAELRITELRERADGGAAEEKLEL